LDYAQLLLQISLLIDVGLVVLIWLVQLIIYPSFTYYQPEALFAWHQKYTTRLAFVVMPLMLGQLLLAIVAVFHHLNFVNASSLTIVLFLWVFTFVSFAPIHFKISEGHANQSLLKLLIKRNWYRTFLWSFLFIFRLIDFIYLSV
jgi:DMSO reductase anchor subunit